MLVGVLFGIVGFLFDLDFVMFCVDFYLIVKFCFLIELLCLVCELVCKVNDVGLFILVLVCDQVQVEELDELLWVFDNDVYILYQIVGEDMDEEEVLVLIVVFGIEVLVCLLVINLCDEFWLGQCECVLEVVLVDLEVCELLCECWCQYKVVGYVLNKYDM